MKLLIECLLSQTDLKILRIALASSSVQISNTDLTIVPFTVPVRNCTNLCLAIERKKIPFSDLSPVMIIIMIIFMIINLIWFSLTNPHMRNDQ